MSVCRAIEPIAISAADVGQLLGISKRMVWSMHRAGTLGPVPLKLSDRVTRWDAAEVREWWRFQCEAGRPIPRVEWLARVEGR